MLSFDHVETIYKLDSESVVRTLIRRDLTSGATVAPSFTTDYGILCSYGCNFSDSSKDMIMDIHQR